MPAAAAKLSQGELAEAALLTYSDAPAHPLIDIGANLADPAFDQACMPGRLSMNLHAAPGHGLTA